MSRRELHEVAVAGREHERARRRGVGARKREIGPLPAGSDEHLRLHRPAHRVDDVGVPRHNDAERTGVRRKRVGEHLQARRRDVVGVHQYLEQSRRILRGLPASTGRTGLLGLTEFLAQQTDALGDSA